MSLPNRQVFLFPVFRGQKFFPHERCEILEGGEDDLSVEAESDRNCWGCR